MRKFLYVVAALGALAWPGAAWAVLEETTVTLTDHGEPLPNATITLKRTDDQPAPQPKTKKTDPTGKVVLVHEKRDKTSDKTVELTVTTPEGRTLTRRVALTALLTSESVDVAQLSEVEQTSKPTQEASAECVNLSKLDDSQLREIVNRPELHTRIVKLINETKGTKEVQHKRARQSQVEKPAHHKSKTVAEHRRRGRRYQESKGSAPGQQDWSGTADAARAGIGIVTGFGPMRGSFGGFHGTSHGEHGPQQGPTPVRSPGQE
jgi:hypothetical protein